MESGTTEGRALLKRHVRSKLPLYGFAFVLLACANVVYSYYPKVLGNFTASLEQDGLTSAAIARYGLYLAFIAIGYGGLFGVGQFLNHWSGRWFEFKAREKLFAHFSTLSDAYYAKNGVGKLLSFVMNDVTTVRESIANGLNQLTNAIVLLASVLFMMAASGIPFYLIAVCALPLLSIPFLVTYFGPRIRERSREVQESLASMSEAAEEQFGGVRVTKSFAVEPIAWKRFDAKVDAIRDKQLRLVKLSSLFQSLIPFAGGISLMLAIAYGGYLTARGTISLGLFVELTLYMKMIVTPLQQIGNVFNIMQRSRASLDRIDQLLATKPDIRDEEHAVDLPLTESHLELKGLTYAYPGASRPSLEAIDLDLKPGQTLGIVGKTGSGKSTLVKLLLRVYDPPKGTVFVGGRDIREIKLSSLRRRIAYVPQDGFLFSTTIRDNISFYDRASSPERVEQAARLAEIYENIAGFPQGFETRLGERGMTLSGGQRQRASIARGLLKDAPILLLDDSVSAVDAITETNILANLRRVRAGKTTIIVAHRISAVKNADCIVVLDKGRILERGSHEELLARGGLYASLQKLQEGGESDAG
ncbi:ABC transporter ATP-binding protein [Gorillibacterium sp. sgz500922]|uniref:ABC transporter ATP-binding protein n=1 Tax=Gorillibacterium sp. sgz500922 TaxID=3446694 RepID=UPI003F663DA8